MGIQGELTISNIHAVILALSLLLEGWVKFDCWLVYLSIWQARCFCYWCCHWGSNKYYFLKCSLKELVIKNLCLVKFKQVPSSSSSPKPGYSIQAVIKCIHVKNKYNKDTSTALIWRWVGSLAGTLWHFKIQIVPIHGAVILWNSREWFQIFCAGYHSAMHGKWLWWSWGTISKVLCFWSRMNAMFWSAVVWY